MMIALVLGASLSMGGILAASGALGFGRMRLTDRLVPPSGATGVSMVGLRILIERFSIAMKPKARLRSALFELPEILELMAVSLTAGDGLFAAFIRVVPRANGVLATELKSILMSLELGGAFDEELKLLGQRLPQRQVVEFANKLSLSIKRGSPLATLLREQAASARSEIRNDLLRQAGRNETRMLIPLVFLILPVTVLFAIYPSLQLLNLNYL
jgi:tight adherence protein C